MRKIAFGYSTLCNLKCGHCVAKGEVPDTHTMDLGGARQIIFKMAESKVMGISFTAGEPLLFVKEMNELVRLCRDFGIYTRIVTNSFWAKTPERADSIVRELKKSGLCQLRLSYSRWHQEGVDRQNLLNAAESCQRNNLDYFISFVTDFSKEDDSIGEFLSTNRLRFFPEPLIYSGLAADFHREELRTDFQANCCAMNPFLTPDLDMYACCDAGSHFNATNVFFLGNLANKSIDELFYASETSALFNVIRLAGITSLAMFAGFKAKEIIRYRKCDLCKEMLNSPVTLKMLKQAAATGVNHWTR